MSVRTRVLFLALVVVLINYVDRGAISYAAQAITTEYGLDRSAWGAVLGTFGYGYMFGALLGGALADRYGPRRVWLVAGVAWSVLEVATGWAGDLGLALAGSALAGFAAIRVVFGLSEGPAYSLLNRSVANWATPRERGFLMGFALASTPIGAMLTAPVAVGLLALTGSWRALFVALGVAGLLALAAFLSTFTDHPEDHPGVAPEALAALRHEAPLLPAHAEPEVPWWAFFRSRTLVANTVGYFAFLYVTFLLLTWTPKYLQDRFSFDLAALWWVGMIPWVGACMTVPLGGRLSDWLLARTGSRRWARSGLAGGSLLLTAACFVAVSRAQSAEVAIAWMTLANALNGLPNAVYWSVVLDTAPRARIGVFSGLTHFFASAASVVAPTLTGWLTQHHGWSAMFVAAAVAAAVGTVAMALVRPGVRA